MRSSSKGSNTNKMSGLARPCRNCGELIASTESGTFCSDCAPDNYSDHGASTERHRRAQTSTSKRGYTYRWQQLSIRARKRQPFCSDCGSTDTDTLTADHTPAAWQRIEQGKTVRLADIDVVCSACNNTRGAARGERSRESERPTRTRPTQTGALLKRRTPKATTPRTPGE